MRFAMSTSGGVHASFTVDVWEDAGRTFEVVMAWDVVNDGMALELTDLDSPESGPAIEAFDTTTAPGLTPRSITRALCRSTVVERFVAADGKNLPPTHQS